MGEGAGEASGWRLILAPALEKELRRLPASDLTRVMAALEGMCADPYGGDVRKLEGTEGEFRRRVGNYRIRFTVDTAGRIVHVLHVLSRGSAYQR